MASDTQSKSQPEQQNRSRLGTATLVMFVYAQPRNLRPGLLSVVPTGLRQRPRLLCVAPTGVHKSKSRRAISFRLPRYFPRCIAGEGATGLHDPFTGIAPDGYRFHDFHRFGVDRGHCVRAIVCRILHDTSGVKYYFHRIEPDIDGFDRLHPRGIHDAERI